MAAIQHFKWLSSTSEGLNTLKPAILVAIAVLGYYTCSNRNSTHTHIHLPFLATAQAALSFTE